MSINHLNSVELFSGAGGLALGMAKSGFQHKMLVEFNRDAVTTLIKNHDEGQAQIKDWNIKHDDIKNISFKKYKGNISVIAGGPPCQPFSLGGKHKAFNDYRDMFPQAVRAVRESKPESFIFENVKGLLRKNFSSYFGYIILQLTYPNEPLAKVVSGDFRPHSGAILSWNFGKWNHHSPHSNSKSHSKWDCNSSTQTFASGSKEVLNKLPRSSIIS